MQTRQLGDRTVSAIGLGGMPLSRARRSTGSLPAREEAIATVHAALEAGVTLIDTADCYAPDPASFGHNEELVAEALRLSGRAPGSDDVLVATKGGLRREGEEWPADGRPSWIRTAVHDSLTRLGAESIDLYQHHRPDPAVPYAETIGTFKELYDEGLVQRVGISNADPAQIREAHAILGNALISVQNEFSPRFRTSEPELEVCEELGLTFLPWSPLGGMAHAADLGTSFEQFAQVAAEHAVSPQQVCIAWLLARSPVIIPIPGASRPESIRDTSAATELTLSAEEFSRLNG